MVTPTFSIIIPAYNEEDNLPRCLESVSRVDYPTEGMEVTVVDNGSTDQTREIATDYGATVLRNDTMYVSGLRNFGAKHSRGDVLAFVDADCVVSKDWLNSAKKYYHASEVVAWGAPAGIPVESTWVQRTWYLVRKKDNPVQEVDWLETMNLFVRKDTFFAIRGFDENLITCEDVDFCYRIRKHGGIVSDNTLQVIHYGEARTVMEFVRKEFWRGKSNLYGIRRHGLSLKELPSLCIPFYFGICLPLVYLGILLFLSPGWLSVFLFLYLLPSAGILIRLRRKKIDALEGFRLLFLVQFYFLARTFGVLTK